MTRIAQLALALLACFAQTRAGEIHEAAAKGDLDKVKALLHDKHELIYGKDDDGRTVLHWAAAQGNSELVKFLLAENADIGALTGSGQTPLHLASANGHSGVMALLLSAKADVFAKDRYGRTPLHAATLNCQKETVEILLNNHADIAATDVNGYTALDFAREMKLEGMAEMLRGNGAKEGNKSNLKDALFTAIESGGFLVEKSDIKGVEAILDLVPQLIASTDNDFNGMTPGISHF